MASKDRSKIGRNNRNKGNMLERITADTLSEWIYGRTKVLRRTPLSGGWSGSKMGDVTVDPEFQRKGVFVPSIYVECRNYRGILQHNFFTWVCYAKPKELSLWIKEVEAKCDGRLPMLVLKGKSTKPWVLFMNRWLDSRQYVALTKLDSYIMFVQHRHLGIVVPLKSMGSVGRAEWFFGEKISAHTPHIKGARRSDP